MSVERIAPDDLDKLIDKAIKKVSVKKENDLCRYLPGPKGGYMHHFTMRKLKKLDPAQFFSLLNKHIIEKESPKALHPKPRAPRGSRKKREFMNFSRMDIEKVLDLARKVGDKELIAKFSPKRPLTSLKRDLIRSIRNNQINDELWNAYVESIKASQYAASTEMSSSY
jgi:hypothetical protein